MKSHLRGRSCNSIIFFAMLTVPIHIGTARLSADEPDPLQINIYWENDGGILKRNNPTDRHYTNGSAISVAHRPQWAKDVAAIIPFHDEFANVAAGYIVGQLMFSPDDIKTTTLIVNDRPYAGYLYGGVYLQRSDTDQRVMDHFQIDLGIVGPSARADDVQDFVHKQVNATEPKGWDNQLGDEFTAQVYYRRKWRLARCDLAESLSLDVIPTAGFALGSVYRHLEAGATVRAGLNLHEDFGPGRLADPATPLNRHVIDAGAPLLSAERLTLYVFGRIAGRAVEHNLFLEGSTFRDSHHVREERLVGEGQVGAVIEYHTGPCRIEIGYSQTFLTREFEGQRDSDSFGALTIGATVFF